MRHWQPIHHERWRDFIAGLSAALSGRPVVPAAHVTRPLEPAAVPAMPPVPVQLPATVAAPAPEPTAEIAEESVVPPAVAAQPLPELRPEPPAPPAPAVVEPVLTEPPVLEPAVVSSTTPEAIVTYQSFTPSVAAPASNLTSRDFFSALAWSGQRTTGRLPRAEAPAVQATSVSAAPSHPEPALVRQPTASTSAVFFGSLPWSGASALGDVIKSIRVTASRDDAGLDPRSAPLPGDNPLLTGMLSAARTSDRLAARPAAPTRASAYFHAIPWSR